MSHRGIGRRAVGVIAVAALALAGVLAIPAAAAQEPPPWYLGPTTGPQYAGFQISPTNPPLNRQLGGYGPVTLTRVTNAPLDDETTFVWDKFDTNGDLILGNAEDEFAWPPTWDGGGYKMTRADSFGACPRAAPTCQYFVTEGNGQNFFFFAGTPTVDVCAPGPGTPPTPGTPPDTSVPTTTATTAPPVCTTQPAFPLDPYDNAFVATFPIPQIFLDALNAEGFAGTGGSAGTVLLTAGKTHDEEPTSTLTYQWVLVHESGTTYTGSGDTFQPTVDADGNYCVALTVTASDGLIKSTPSCAPGGGGAVFQITGVAPAPAAPPAPTPVPDSGGIGGGTGGGGGGIPGIGFSNLAQRAPSILTGAGGASPTVVWLWRPEWFTPTNEKSDTPRTDGQPEVRGRRVIIVRSPTPHGASAGPWLAAVGIFGLFGGGWMLSRRRRLRMLAEL